MPPLHINTPSVDVEQLTQRHPFDPYLFGEWADYLERCGRGHRITARAGVARPHKSMCRSLRCLRGVCSAWRITDARNPRAFRSLYDAMRPPLFAGAEIIYFRPTTPERWPSTHKALTRAGAPWLRASIVADDGDTEIVLVFSGDFDPTRKGDDGPATAMTPADARAFYFDEVLRPGWLAHKPTASKKSGWELPPDPPGDGIDLGFIEDDQLARQVVERFSLLYGIEVASLRSKHVTITAEREKAMAKVVYSRALGEVLGEQ